MPVAHPRRAPRCSLLIVFFIASMIGFEYFFPISHTLPAAFRGALDESNRESRRLITESFVISFDSERADKFVKRNHHSDIDPVLWVPAVDGFSQKVLTSWAHLTGKFPPINASLFGPNDKGKYQSPDAVGCYMAHWHLMRQLGHRDQELRPDLYFVFEDDASCIPNLTNRTLEVARLLQMIGICSTLEENLSHTFTGQCRKSMTRPKIRCEETFAVVLLV